MHFYRVCASEVESVEDHKPTKHRTEAISSLSFFFLSLFFLLHPVSGASASPDCSLSWPPPPALPEGTEAFPSQQRNAISPAVPCGLLQEDVFWGFVFICFTEPFLYAPKYLI